MLEALGVGNTGEAYLEQQSHLNSVYSKSQKKMREGQFLNVMGPFLGSLSMVP